MKITFVFQIHCIATLVDVVIPSFLPMCSRYLEVGPKFIHGINSTENNGSQF